MGSEKSDSLIKKTLRNLCSANGWSYAIFWGFDQINFLLLTFQDSYYEEEMGDIIKSMLPQVHVFGRGVVGQAAFTKSSRWIFSQTCLEFIGSPQDDSEFYWQFCTGIKTIAVISVEPFGVVQFGSTNNIPERKEFVDQVKEHFTGMDNVFAGHQYDEDLMDSNWNSSLFENQIQMGSTEMEQLILAYFDCSTAPAPTSHTGDSVITSSWNPNDQSSTLLFPSNHSSPDDLSQWFSSLQNECNTLQNSMQSSITESLKNSDGRKRCSSFVLDNQSKTPQTPAPEDWSEILMPFANSEHLDSLKCIASEQFVGSKIDNNNSLFSKLGLDNLLGSTSTASSSCSPTVSRFEDQISPTAKRRKFEDHSWSIDPFKLPLYDPNKTSFLEPKHEISMKEGPQIGDRCSVNNLLKRNQGPAKKKAKPGTRPRPKDRQLIQDCLAELRQIVPNGEKVSIDRLLQQTIRHLNFMQSLVKHRESLKQTDSGDSGATWACEVGDQSMLCPLIVKDLSSSGQMLIEALCDEQSFFLEIVDVIRNLGLTILKGVMEVEERKFRAHLIVEAEGKWHVTRHEIFSSLIQLLHMSSRPSANIDTSLFNNYVSLPIDSLQHTG